MVGIALLGLTSPNTASFEGMSNVFPAHYTKGCCNFAGHAFETLPELPVWTRSFAALRPEDVFVGGMGDFPKDWQVLRGTVERLEREGFTWTAVVRCGDQAITALVDRHMVLNRELVSGSSVTVGFAGEHLHHMPEVD